MKHLARLEIPVLIAGDKPHDLVDHRLRLVVLDKTHDGLLHDGDAVLDRIAPAVHDAPSDGDALVARRIGERVAFLPVLRPFQHVGLHVEDLPEIVKHLLLDRADVAAQAPGASGGPVRSPRPPSDRKPCGPSGPCRPPPSVPARL